MKEKILDGSHSLPNLRSDTPHFCSFLFVRSEWLELAHTQGDGITQGCEYQEDVITGGHFRGCLPRGYILK